MGKRKVMHGWTDAEVAAESEEHVSFHELSFHELSFHELHEQITYGPNMELIHPRIAKLWAKE